MPAGWHGRVVFPRSKHFLLGFLPSKYKQKYSGLSGELNTERAMNERVNEWRDTAWDKGKVLTGVSPLVVRWGPRLHSANFFIHCPSFHGRQIRFTILGTLPLRPDIFSFQRCRHLFYFLNNSLTRLLFLQFCAAVPEFQRFQCDSWNRSFHRRLQGRTSSIQSIEIFSQNKVHTVSPVLFFFQSAGHVLSAETFREEKSVQIDFSWKCQRASFTPTQNIDLNHSIIYTLTVQCRFVTEIKRKICPIPPVSYRWSVQFSTG